VDVLPTVEILLHRVYDAVGKSFKSGNSQAIRILKKFHIEEDELYIKKIGNSILLTSKEDIWDGPFRNVRIGRYGGGTRIRYSEKHVSKGKQRNLPIVPYDLHIAAQCLSRKLLLVTRNVQEFRRVPGLYLENWTE
jgi:virulence-associated protein VagC